MIKADEMMADAKDYFSAHIVYDDLDVYLIWCQNTIDGVVMDGDMIVGFASKVDLMQFCAANSISLMFAEDFFTVQLPALLALLKRNRVQAHAILTAWNLIDDIARTLQIELYRRSKFTEQLYRKVFWASNLPSVTPKGRRFDPGWSRLEIRYLSLLLEAKFARIRERVALYTPDDNG